MSVTCLANRLAEIDFYNRYLSGVREFSQLKLERAKFSNKIFAELDLRQANLNYSTLDRTSIKDSDLSESSLVSTNLKKSSIDNVIFNRANLTNLKLSQSKITNVSFFGACLYKASFCGGKINNADFSFANLSAAYLAGIDLSTSMFEGAIYSSNTAFPDEFDPIEAGMVHESEMFDVERILTKFDSLYQQALHCLGDKITAKYFHSSRPEHDWLNTIETNNRNRIVFKGEAIKSFNYAEAEYLRQWMIMFANLCFKLVNNVRDDEELFSGFLLS